MRFDAEAIAMRFANRPGCRFLGFKSVGICVYALKLRTVIVESTGMPPLEEFVLRFLGAGIETPRDLSRLMGLEQGLIERRLVELRRGELIEVHGSDETPRDMIRCTLTERGRESASVLQRKSMQEVTIPDVLFHGLLRRPVEVGSNAKGRYLRPQEAKDRGLELIRAIPGRPPSPEEVGVSELERVLNATLRPKPGDQSREVVAVKAVLRPVTVRYEQAVMLEFETTDRSRVRQIAFAIAGQLDEEYEASFARAKGPELLREVVSPRTEPLEERLRREVPNHVRARLGRLDDVEGLAAQAVSAKQRVSDLQDQLAETDRADTRQLLRDELEEALRRAERAEADRDARKVKYLMTSEIRTMLWSALEQCNERLLILSGFITSRVVDERFEEALREALRRGVLVRIGYGFDKDLARGKQDREGHLWKQAEARLARLAAAFPALMVYRDVGVSHEKRVICDYRFTFGGSFNYLSFAGQPDWIGAKVRHEGADLISDPEYCRELFDRYEKMFFR